MCANCHAKSENDDKNSFRFSLGLRRRKHRHNTVGSDDVVDDVAAEYNTYSFFKEVLNSTLSFALKSSKNGEYFNVAREVQHDSDWVHEVNEIYRATFDPLVRW